MKLDGFEKINKKQKTKTGKYSDRLLEGRLEERLDGRKT